MALVKQLLALGDGQLHLHLPVLKVDGQGDQAEPLGLLQAVELGDLSLMGKQRPCSEGIVVENVAMLIAGSRTSNTCFENNSRFLSAPTFVAV